MRTLKKFAVISLAVLLFDATNVTSQEFRELNLKQLGEKANIEYSIVGERLGQLFNVTPTYSVDGGKSFLPMKSVTGKLERVLRREYQVIIWDVLKDVPALQGILFSNLPAMQNANHWKMISAT